MKRTFIILFILILLHISANTSHSAQYWAKTYGGNRYDGASSIIKTSDGKYIVAGLTKSFGVETYDAWIVKLNTDGNIIWQKMYDIINDNFDSHDDLIRSIHQSSDGNYIVFGSSKLPILGADRYIWIMKLDPEGDIIWQKKHEEGNESVLTRGIHQTADGGYMVSGSSCSSSGWRDFWLMKLDSNGDVDWKNTYGADYRGEEIYSFEQTTDGGYIVAGHRSGSVGNEREDIWAVKINADGSIAWQKIYEGSGINDFTSIQQTADGGYILGGVHESSPDGSTHLLLLKLNTDGSIAWQKMFDKGWANAILQEIDGGYIVSGGVNYSDGVWSDLWLLRVNTNGEIPGCLAMTIGNLIANDTAIISQDTFAPVQASSVIVSDTNIVYQDSLAETSTKCCYDPSDYDCDDVLNENDNCPENINTHQEDIDSDSIGDVCDNCVNKYNINQEDTSPPQGNGIGDAC